MRDPIWGYLKQNNIRLKWLAKQLGYDYGYVRGVASGYFSASFRFRVLSSRLLGKSESDLWLEDRPQATRQRRAPRPNNSSNPSK